MDFIISRSVKTGIRNPNNKHMKLCIFSSCVKVALVLLVLPLFTHPALADYNFDGYPSADELEEEKKGTVKGGVYVDGGHGIGPSPYSQSFNIPGDEVSWARLYVGVWGGSEDKSGSISVTYNGEEFDTLELEGEDDKNDNVYCSGHGVYWIYYDVTDNTSTGTVEAEVTTSGDIDGRVYGVVLVAVYTESDSEDNVQYWINEGNVNLHGEGWAGEYEPNEVAVANFSGTVKDTSVAARLTVVYLTGTPGLNDYLYFNDEQLCDDDNCDDIANSRDYFDIKTFDVFEYLVDEDNQARFELGDEDYVHPVLSVLTVHRRTGGYSPDGTSLQTVQHGEVNGGMYISGGHGRVYTTSYTQNFTMPDGTVKWARLYVSAKDTTWINASLNGHVLGNYTNLTNNPQVYANYQEDHSMYWAYYDNVAEYIASGHNTATADLGTKVGYYTKSWGMILLAAYEGGDNPEHIDYWVNEGNPLLHGDHLPFTAHRNTTLTSFENIPVDNITNATLWTAYIWGSEESDYTLHDSLWCNSDLIAKDPSDGAGTDDQGNTWRGACFDLEQWDVTHNLTRDNLLYFDRGGDGLLCPVGAILVVRHEPESIHSGHAVDLSARILPAVSFEVTPAALDFGILAPGWHSDPKLLNISNTGTCTITVTPAVTDTAAGLYTDGVLLDSVIWSSYRKVIAQGNAIDVSTVLDIPPDYTEVGTQKGIIIFWAQKE